MLKTITVVLCVNQQGAIFFRQEVTARQAIDQEYEAVTAQECNRKVRYYVSPLTLNLINSLGRTAPSSGNIFSVSFDVTN